MRLVFRSVRHRPARSLVAIAGIAVSTLLVLVLMGAYRSLTRGVRTYVGSPRVDLWVAPLGTDNLIRSSGLLPEAVLDSIATLPEVRETGPLARGFVAVRGSRSRSAPRAPPVNLLAMGYRTPAGMGGPPQLVGGRLPQAPREIVLDRAAAHRVGAAPGDTVVVNGLKFELVGTSSGTNLLATQFAFFDVSSLEDTNGISGQYSFVAVGVHPAQQAEAVARLIRSRHPRVAVYVRDDFVDNNIREVAAGFRPMQLMVSGMGVLAAAVLVALLVQGGVEDRRQDIAVLLAMGTPARSIGVGLIAHAALLVVVGGGVGGGALFLLNTALVSWAPTLELAPRPLDLAFVLPLFMLVSGLAASVPLGRLRRVDPITAFRP